ncbi:MAG: FHA domain-containing protein [Candidatus Promineifilaceae bacterium]|nr:FHA domain-containing protein [Candidatus Promineifilaceae bacterium]
MIQYPTRRFVPSAVFALVLLLVAVLSTQAQGQPTRIIVTGAEGSSAPTIELTVYGVDGSGQAVDLSNTAFEVTHDGEAVEEVTVARQDEIGTLTVFVLDLPQGVADQIEAVQQAVISFAVEPTMKEQIDKVAIFQVGELGPEQVLAPEGFYNSVRNAFATPLTAQTGNTALIDSLMNVLNNLPAIQEDPRTVVHLVVFSDGTDTVSTQFSAPDVPRLAAELNVPIHTAWLNNPRVTASKEAGRQYMEQLAAGTGGLTTSFTIGEELQPIWQRIASFRSQSVVQYTLSDLAGGEYAVELSLANNPAISDGAIVTVPPGAPSVTLNIPPASRQLSVANIGEPVELSLATDVAWLDGVDRDITRAQLLVNGVVVQDIPPEDLERFGVTIANFLEGANRIQVAVVDSEGSRAVSPVVELTVSQGDTQVPEEIQPLTLTDRILQSLGRLRVLWIGCAGILGTVLLLAVAAFIFSRIGSTANLGFLRYLRRVPFLRPFMAKIGRFEGQMRHAQSTKRRYSRYVPDVRSVDDDKQQVAARTTFLEVIQSTTNMPGRLELEAVEQKLGRSGKQADIVFKEDSTVSRLHATIAREGSDYRIFDEQSTSGTYVNEQRVPPHGLQLVDGDEIRLGAVRLRFRQL